MESERGWVELVGDMARKDDGGCGRVVGEDGEEGGLEVVRKACGRSGLFVVVDVVDEERMAREGACMRQTPKMRAVEKKDGMMSHGMA